VDITILRFSTDYKGTRSSACTSDKGVSWVTGSVNKTMLKPRTPLQRPIRIRRIFPTLIRSGSGIRTIIRNRAQNLISSSMSRYLSIRNISSKFMHAYSRNRANRQTDRQTRAKHLPPPSAEVNKSLSQTIQGGARITMGGE